MPDEYVITELWDLFWLYADNAFAALTQKSIFALVIQGVLIAFSFWDRNSRFFVILAAIGVYSVHGSISVWISLKRRKLAAERLCRIKYRQYILAVKLRCKKPLYKEILFIPENNAEDNFSEIYNLKYINYGYGMNLERNYIYG